MDGYYWFIEDGQQEMCALPFTEEERAIFWREYLEVANPKRGPYRHFYSPHTLSSCGKIIPLKQEKEHEELHGTSV